MATWDSPPVCSSEKRNFPHYRFSQKVLTGFVVPTLVGYSIPKKMANPLFIIQGAAIPHERLPMKFLSDGGRARKQKGASSGGSGVLFPSPPAWGNRVSKKKNLSPSVSPLPPPGGTGDWPGPAAGPSPPSPPAWLNRAFAVKSAAGGEGTGVRGDHQGWFSV